MAERPLAAVPRPVLALLVLAFVLQIAGNANRAAPVARAAALPPAPNAAILRAASLGEPITLAQMLTLYLQSFDNQPGISIPFRELDYPRVIGWLDAILDLDAVGQYPLLMASQLYAQVPVEGKQRLMLAFVHRKFLEDPGRRWRWLAHAAILAKHRLKDNVLALTYAGDLARHAAAAPSWVRQMRIFILEDMGELESATVLLGGLLANGGVTDPNEIRFLTNRLERMKNVEESSSASKH